MKCDHTLHLSDICDYVKDKIAITALNRNNYVSTENMLANKAGIVRASSLPAVAQTQTFLSGDVLVSNIRPYFKKIWFAKFDGGCSNDVLVFRAKEGVSSRFLYYVLANDTFFAYSTATSKGTKMPRGDKTAIMEYEVPRITPEGQEKITAILSALDDKIELNNKINANLEQQAQALYQEWFVNTDDATQGGFLSDICIYSKDKIAISRLSPNTYFSTENMLPNKVGAVEASGLPTVAQTTACHVGDTLVSNIRPYFKKIVYCYEMCGCSTDVLCFVPTIPTYSAYLYSVLYADSFFDFMVAGSKGTKMPRGDKQQIMTYPVVIPSSPKLEAFNSMAIPILAKIRNNHNENKRLALLRDGLLSKLMNGEFLQKV